MGERDLREVFFLGLCFCWFARCQHPRHSRFMKPGSMKLDGSVYRNMKNSILRGELLHGVIPTLPIRFGLCGCMVWYGMVWELVCSALVVAPLLLRAQAVGTWPRPLSHREYLGESHVLFCMSHVSPITTLWSISDSGNYKSRTERPQSVAFYQGKKK